MQVVKGAVLDVAVDARHGSPTFGEYISIELSEENKKQFWIPPGFLHGFVALKDETIFSYKCTDLYDPDSEVGVSWSDPDLKIDWKLKENGISEPVISEKDQENINFKNIDRDFNYKK